MDDKKKAIIECINEIKLLHQQEEAQINQMVSILNAHPIEIIEDDISRLFGAPLAICEGCKHWNNSVCNIIQYGCHFEVKN